MKLKTTSIQWQVATYMEDNPDKKLVRVNVNGTDIKLGALQKGQRANVPVQVIDGKRFMTDAQLVEVASKPKRTRRRKVDEE